MKKYRTVLTTHNRILPEIVTIYCPSWAPLPQIDEDLQIIHQASQVQVGWGVVVDIDSEDRTYTIQTWRV